MKPFPLYTTIALSGMMFGAEIVASHFTQSLAMLVSAYHMLYNLLSLLLLVISHKMSKGKTIKNTFGWARIKVLGMLVNMLFLCALCFAASVESLQTIVHALHEDTKPRYPLLFLCLGGLNFTLNIICFVLIGGYTHHQGCSMIIQGNEIQVNYVLADTNIGDDICPNILQQKKQKLKKNIDPDDEECPRVKMTRDHKFLDLSRDTSSCIIVMICACIILFMNGLILKYADAILAFASVIILLATTYPFIRESGLILLQSIPNHVDVDGLTDRLLKEFPAVQNVHDLHVWRLTASEVIATVHIMLSSPEIYSPLSSDLKTFFEDEGITLVTIQPEFLEGPTRNSECILQCSTNNNCGALTCCGPQTQHRSDIRLRCITTDCQENKETSKKELHQSSENLSYDLPPIKHYDFGKISTAIETRV